MSDGGHAIHEALTTLHQEDLHQRDVWHVLQQAAKVQARLETVVSHEEERLRTITQYEYRQAQGERVGGRPPKTDGREQQQVVKQLLHVWEAVASVFREVQRLLEVVVLDHPREGG